MKYFIPLCGVMLLASSTAWASLFGGLYEAEVAVADQSSEVRVAGLADALRQVVVKVSGNGAAVQSRALNEALRNPGRYVQQYSYRGNDGSAATQSPLLLGATFDSRSVDQLLRSAGLPIWGASRALTIVWLVVEQGGQKLLVGANDRGQVRSMVERAAQRRGLPLRLPLLDAADQARVQPSDGWGDLHEPIRKASQRYEAPVVLVGRLGQAAPGRWQVRWTLYQGERSQQWSQQGDKVEALVTFGIDAATDLLASNQSAVPDTPVVAQNSDLYWVVREVRNLRGYRRLLDYVTGLSGVNSVQVVQISGDSMRLRITAGGGEGALQQQLAQEATLVPVKQETTGSAPLPALLQPGDRFYRLVP